MAVNLGVMVNLDSTGRHQGGTRGSEGEFAWAHPEAGRGPCRVGEGEGGWWLSTGASGAERESGGASWANSGEGGVDGVFGRLEFGKNSEMQWAVVWKLGCGEGSHEAGGEVGNVTTLGAMCRVSRCKLATGGRMEIREGERERNREAGAEIGKAKWGKTD